MKLKQAIRKIEIIRNSNIEFLDKLPKRIDNEIERRSAKSIIAACAEILILLENVTEL